MEQVKKHTPNVLAFYIYMCVCVCVYVSFEYASFECVWNRGKAIRISLKIDMNVLNNLKDS